VIRGHEAVLLIDRGGVTVAPEPPFAKGFEDKCAMASLKGEWRDVELRRWGGARKVKALRIPEREYPDRFTGSFLHDDFIKCIRTREKPNADVEQGHYSALVCHMANISYLVGNQKLTFDPKTESFVNSPEANKYLKRTYREPWVIPDQV